MVVMANLILSRLFDGSRKLQVSHNVLRLIVLNAPYRRPGVRVSPGG